MSCTSLNSDQYRVSGRWDDSLDKWDLRKEWIFSRQLTSDLCGCLSLSGDSGGLVHKWAWSDALHQHGRGLLLPAANDRLHAGDAPVPSQRGGQGAGLLQRGQGESLQHTCTQLPHSSVQQMHERKSIRIFWRLSDVSSSAVHKLDTQKRFWKTIKLQDKRPS